MTIEDDIALLERVPTFAPLGREALRILAIGTESRSVRQGDTLFRAGDAADGGYVVESGSFELRADTERAYPVIAGPGALLGELALLTETQRPTTATARELSSVMRISRPLFLKMLDGYPEVADRLHRSMLSRTALMTEELGRVRNALASLDPPPTVPESEPPPEAREA
jgi:CRP-like cAMP-binding protein